MQIKKSSMQIKKSSNIYNQCTVSHSESESKSGFSSDSDSESDNSALINLDICIFFALYLHFSK